MAHYIQLNRQILDCCSSGKLWWVCGNASHGKTHSSGGSTHTHYTKVKARCGLAAACVITRMCSVSCVLWGGNADEQRSEGLDRVWFGLIWLGSDEQPCYSVWDQ
jgi:hypothetical protein